MSDKPGINGSGSDRLRGDWVEIGFENDVISEAELNKFISRIIACGIEENIAISLRELQEILRREGAGVQLIELLEDLRKASPEMAKLGRSIKQDVTSDDLAKAIRESRDRIRREESFRC
ncbi:MAG: hypothetical protein K6E85_16805 [Lachnospiraceae bacterium]|nr:hypothetical protein [Lachnospiraceae bacterium]